MVDGLIAIFNTAAGYLTGPGIGLLRYRNTNLGHDPACRLQSP